MKIIFLDIDGILWVYPNEIRKRFKYHKMYSTEQGVSDNILGKRDTKSYKITEEFDPTCCSNLNWLLEQVPGAKIVVSSTWRRGRTLKQLERILLKNKVSLAKGRVIGKTPEFMSRSRGREINSWLQHEEVSGRTISSYVILDDDSDMRKDQMENFVQTDSMTGLTLYDAALAAFILGDRQNTDILNYMKFMKERLSKEETLRPKLFLEIENAIEAKRLERQTKYGSSLIS